MITSETNSDINVAKYLKYLIRIAGKYNVVFFPQPAVAEGRYPSGSELYALDTVGIWYFAQS